MAQALERIGPEWVVLLPLVARELAEIEAADQAPGRRG